MWKKLCFFSLLVVILVLAGCKTTGKAFETTADSGCEAELEMANKVIQAYNERVYALNSFVWKDKLETCDDYKNSLSVWWDIQSEIERWIKYEYFVNPIALISSQKEIEMLNKSYWDEHEFFFPISESYKLPWRRMPNGSYPVLGDFLYGRAQEGDIIGPWIFEDLEKALRPFRKTVRFCGRYSTYYDTELSCLHSSLDYGFNSTGHEETLARPSSVGIRGTCWMALLDSKSKYSRSRRNISNSANYYHQVRRSYYHFETDRDTYVFYFKPYRSKSVLEYRFGDEFNISFDWALYGIPKFINNGVYSALSRPYTFENRYTLFNAGNADSSEKLLAKIGYTNDEGYPTNENPLDLIPPVGCEIPVGTHISEGYRVGETAMIFTWEFSDLEGIPGLCSVSTDCESEITNLCKENLCISGICTESFKPANTIVDDGLGNSYVCIPEEFESYRLSSLIDLFYGGIIS
jgi:hypothetical protein